LLIQKLNGFVELLDRQLFVGCQVECVLEIVLPLAVGVSVSGLFVNLREVFDSALNFKRLFLRDVPGFTNELEPDNFFLIDVDVAVSRLSNDAVFCLGVLDDGRARRINVQRRHGKQHSQLCETVSLLARHHYLAQPEEGERFRFLAKVIFCEVGT